LVLLALFGLTQSFTSPNKVFWIRELSQSTGLWTVHQSSPSLAGYMGADYRVTIGRCLAVRIEKEKRLLYIFMAGLMGVALVMTSLSCGIISLVAETLFFVVVTALWRPDTGERHSQQGAGQRCVGSSWIGCGLLVALFVGVLLLGGEFSITRFIDSGTRRIQRLVAPIFGL